MDRLKMIPGVGGLSGSRNAVASGVVEGNGVPRLAAISWPNGAPIAIRARV